MPRTLPARTPARPPSKPIAATAAPQIRPGDVVQWTNGWYQGTVLTVNHESAVVAERDNKLIGGTVKWRLSLEALTRVPGPTPKLPEDRGGKPQYAKIA